MSIKVIKIGQPNCQPCVAYTPIFKEWAENNKNIITEEVDATANPEVASKYRIMSTPATVVVSGEETVGLHIGVLTMDGIDKLVNEARGY